MIFLTILLLISRVCAIRLGGYGGQESLAGQSCQLKGYFPNVMKCLNQKYMIPSFEARGDLLAYADIFQNFYAFTDIAADPLSTHQENAMNWTLYSHPYRLLDELRVAAETFQNDHSMVPLVPFLFKVTDIFAKLRDQHVFPFGGSDVTSHIIPTKFFSMQVFNVTDSELSGGFDSFHPVFLDIKQGPNDTEPLMYYRSKSNDLESGGQQITTIDEMRPMDWIIDQFVDSTLCSSNFFRVRGRGNRINQALLIAGREGLGYCKLSYVGDISKLKPSFEVDVEGRSKPLIWAWLVDNSQVSELKPYPIHGLLETILGHFSKYMRVNQKVHEEVNFLEQITTEKEPTLLKDYSSELSEEEGKWFQSNVKMHCEFKARYCVIKLVTFDPQNQSKKLYAKLVEEFNKVNSIAKENGISNVIIDVVGNGGGQIPFGILLAGALFPNSKPEDVLPLVSYKVSAADEWRIAHNLTPGTFLSAVEKEISDGFWDQRAKEWKRNNCSNILLTEEIWNAVDLLIGASTYYQVNPFNTSEIFSFIRSVKEKCNITGRTLQNFFETLQQVYMDHGDTEANLDEVELKEFGGKKGFYTKPDSKFAKFYMPFISSVDKSVFKDILLLSDGYCGSTCGFFGLAAITNSRLKQDSPRFRSVVFGGNGEPPQEQDLVPTVFHGGNVYVSDLYTTAWVNYAIGVTMYKLGGFESLRNIDEFGSLIPKYPKYTSGPPAYVGGGAYVPLLGDGSTFSEFYVVPADLYIQQWFLHTAIDGSDLPFLYGNASTFFAS